MQCSDCGACGFKFKNSTQSSQSLVKKESFSIFTGPAKGQSQDSPAIESVGLLDEQEPSAFIDFEKDNFNLDLSATSRGDNRRRPNIIEKYRI